MERWTPLCRYEHPLLERAAVGHQRLDRRCPKVLTSNPTPNQSVLPSDSALTCSPTFDRSRNPSPNPQIASTLPNVTFDMSFRHTRFNFDDVLTLGPVFQKT